MNFNLENFTDVLGDEIYDSQPISFPSSCDSNAPIVNATKIDPVTTRPAKCTGQYGHFRSIEEIDPKYRSVFSYPFFNLVQSNVIEDALYSDKSMVVCAPTGSGKTVVFEMAIVQLLMEMEDKCSTEDFKIIYMAPVKALCTERLTEWYPKFTRLGLLCIEVTGDTDVDFSMLKPYRIIITTPEKWDMLTRRWRDHRSLVEVIKLFLIDEVHILNDEARGPVLEAVVSRMKTIESSAQSAHRIELLQKQYQGSEVSSRVAPPRIRFVAVSATVSNPDDVAAWLTSDKPAVYYKFGDECRPVKLKRVVEGYPCPEGTSIFKFDIILNYKLWPIIQKYHNGKPTLIFCNTRKSVALTAETLSRELTISFSPEQKAKLTALASTIKNKKLQSLVLHGVGCHHAGLLFEERTNIELAFRNRDLPILITTTTLAMGVNLPAHLVIIKNTQQYVNGAYQEYSISTVLQMVGRAGRPQFDTEATAVIMTRLNDKPRYQALVGGSEPLQSYLHKRLPENLNSEAALGTVTDVAQCVQWLRSTFLFVRAARDPKRYLGLPPAAPEHLISKKIEELCVKAMNGLATSGLITMDEASCIESTEAGRLMSVFYLDLETMKHIMKINGTESLERLLWIVCESHELADMHLRVDERRSLNSLNRNHSAATIRFPIKGKISTRQMKVNCMIQAILGCLPIPDPSLNQEAMKIMRIADRVCKCLVAYVTRVDLISKTPQYFAAVLNSLLLAKCVASHLWENSPFVSKQLKGIGPTFSALLATAGKVNFMLLEESHPRDLERIMNKGPPAGNVLRKQIGLLPKYQLLMMPIDEKSVTIQLTLLNQSYLSENMDHLTAGDNHKSYIVVGDSENHLLLLTSFKDKDLISIYDGNITYRITRKHNFEHKLLAHCISSTFVGIDAQCEYLFKDLEPVSTNTHAINEEPAKKQTCITDTSQRKRKSGDLEISQSKEKKKRENALIEKFKYLKESFGKTSEEIKGNLEKSAEISDKILKVVHLDKPSKSNDITSGIRDVNIAKQSVEDYSFDNFTVEELDGEDFIDAEKIDIILNEIESEISKENKKPDFLQVMSNKLNVDGYSSREKISARKSVPYKDKNKIIKTVSQNSTNSKDESSKSLNAQRKRKNINTKSNYNFIDLLERNLDLSDEEENKIANKDCTFTDTIKSQIEKYLEETHNTTKVPDETTKNLLQNIHQTEISNERIEQENKKVIKLEPIVTINKGANRKTLKDENVITKKYVVETKNSNTVICPVTEKNNKPEENDVHVDPNIRQLTTLMPIVCESDGGTVHFENYITLHSGHTKIPLVPPERLCELGLQNLIRDSCAITPSKVNNKGIHKTITSPIDLPNKLLPIKELNQINESLSLIKKAEKDNRNEIDNQIVISHTPLIPKIILSPNNPDISPQQKEHGQNDKNRPTNQTKNRNEYVKKFSFTKTKIDVCTKAMNDHTVQVIRKLKVDLDITEIVSREKTNIRKTDSEVRESEQISNDNTCYKNITSTDNKESITYDDPSQDDIFLKNKILLHNNEICKVKKETISELAGEEEEIKKINELGPINTEQILPESKNYYKNKVENILQKYSKVLQKSHPREAVLPHYNTKLNRDRIKNIKSPTEKPERLFKITDIDNITAPLKKTLINEPYSSPINSTVFPKIRREKIEERLDVDNKFTGIDENITDNINIECKSPVPIDLNLDYKIDQAMFDPKTLLQCFDKPNTCDVVPPPAQFCNVNPTSYSPNCTQDTEDSRAPVNYIDCSPWCENISNISSEMVYDKNIFGDSQDAELTPSTEIETWALSREDSLENTFNQIRSYTVMHKSTSTKNIQKNGTASRLSKLSQFKFKHKNKLKM